MTILIFNYYPLIAGAVMAFQNIILWVIQHLLTRGICDGFI